MAKFEVGQVVRVKSEDFLRPREYEGPGINHGMYSYAGKIIEIVSVVERYDYVRYRANSYWWDESWLEPVKTSHVDKDLIMNLLEV